MSREIEALGPDKPVYEFLFDVLLAFGLWGNYITSSSSTVKRNDNWFMYVKVPTIAFDTK